MVCDIVELLIQASIKIQVRVMTTLQGSVLSVVSTPVTVISPTVIVFDIVELVLQASIKIPVRVMTTLQLSVFPARRSSDLVISPTQLSLAVRSPGAGTSAIHS